MPDVRFGPFVQDRTLFARDVVRFEGEIVAAVAAYHRGDRPDGRRRDRGRVRAAARRRRTSRRRWQPTRRSCTPSGRRTGPPTCWFAIATMHRSRRSPRATSMPAWREADHVVTSRYVADGRHAAPIEPRAVVAQWEGNKVTIWTSTQVPFDARAGVCETLELPANRVRIIVPHLGGGFGGKCGFHYEAHIAALAQAAKRPVRLVFSRREEFLAPDRRREGMVIDIETGVRNDGTITARKAWLAARQRRVHGRQRVLPAARRDARRRAVQDPERCDRRAPGLHQPPAVGIGARADRTAGVLGARVAHRRGRAADRDGPGRVPPAQRGRHRRRGPERPDVRRDRPAAVHRGGHRARRATDVALPDDEAIGVAIGWWPSFAVASGAYVKIDGDGSGQIITGAQECGTGAVMTLRQLAAEELGMEPEDFEMIYQDTSAAPYDMGATGSQTVFNNGRAVVAAAGQVADQLRGSRGRPPRGRRRRHRAGGRSRPRGRHARPSRCRSPSSPGSPPVASC